MVRGNQLLNNATIYEVCTTENGVITLEEYIDGVRLDILMSSKKLSRKQSCKYICDICDALTSLHSYGIVHCDIKPSNIIIDRNNRAYLIDLSISKSIIGDYKDNTPLGTPGFAAPEQFGIAEVCEATDVYALGIMLNIMLTGCHPTVDCCNGHLGKIISKAISTPISQRYQSAKDFKKDLKFYTI